MQNPNTTFFEQNNNSTSKLFFSLFNTEETQTLIILIFCTLVKDGECGSEIYLDSIIYTTLNNEYFGHKQIRSFPNIKIH